MLTEEIESIDKLKKQGENQDIKLRLLEQRIKYLTQAINELDEKIRFSAREIISLWFVTACLSVFAVTEVLIG